MLNSAEASLNILSLMIDIMSMLTNKSILPLNIK